jgi:hypothetical protein
VEEMVQRKKGVPCGVASKEDNQMRMGGLSWFPHP